MSDDQTTDSAAEQPKEGADAGVGAKPKATLIKKKPEPPPPPPEEAADAEKKKVVVVKKPKKIVVKRKPTAQKKAAPAAAATTAAAPTTAAAATASAADEVASPPRPAAKANTPAAAAGSTATEAIGTGSGEPQADAGTSPAERRPLAPSATGASSGAKPRADADAGSRAPADKAPAAGETAPRRRLTTAADRIRAAEESPRRISTAAESGGIQEPTRTHSEPVGRMRSPAGPGRGMPRTQGGRPGGRPRPSPGGRPPGRPGSGPRRDRNFDSNGGASSSGAPTTEGKPGAKKFFKTNRTRRPAFEYGPEEHEEKLASFARKKEIPKTNPVPKQVDILETTTVSELAKKLNLKASDLIAKLMSMGTMATINQQIDADTATILAEEYGSKVNVVSLFDETVIEEESVEDADLETRPPVVTIMGHVDHGKTQLLDAIRNANVVAGEAGGITQHIGAYGVDTASGRIVFLDTPGHEAFTAMRARGAQVTDLVVLVVAADDGLMPQTVEAINHAKAADVPIIVAINKMDLEAANPERVKRQLSEQHDLTPEEWGGSALFGQISALKNEGIEGLLESISLQAELLDLKASYKTRAVGKVVESRVDLGRGIVATVLVQRGTLKQGDSFVAGVFPGKIRTMYNDRGERVKEATPSEPVQIVGLTGIPDAGDPFQATENERSARQVGEKRQELKKAEEAQAGSKVTLDNIYEQISEGDVQELKVVIKADVHGSVEALRSALERLSTGEIKLNVIHAAAGAINKDDIALASASNAIVIGFHIRPAPNAQALAEREKVEVRKYDIIYEVIDDVRKAMEGLLSPDVVEQTLGMAEVRETFRYSRTGVIAGCYVQSGTVRRGAVAQVNRDGRPIYRSRVETLRRFKDDAREVEAGFECGIRVENFNDVKIGDVIEVIEVTEVAKTLEASAASSRSASSAGQRESVGATAQKG